MRFFFKSLAGLVVICILAAVIVFFIAKSRAPDLVADRLSKALKVSVEIGDMGFSFNKIKIENLEIGNPPGYKLQRAFTTKEIDIKAPLMGYLKKDIVIDEIALNNVYLGLEFASPKGANGNWTAIMKNAQDAQTASAPSASDKSVLIKRLVLNNISADLLYQSDGKVRRLPVIPQIVLVNISSKGGNLMDQLMNSALGEMLKEIFVQENLKNLLDNIFNFPGSNAPTDIIQGIKGLFGDEEEEVPDLTNSP